MTDLFRILGGLGSLLVLPWALFMLAVSVASPFMLVSVVKNVARMRRALERIADAHESRPMSGGGGVLGI